MTVIPTVLGTDPIPRLFRQYALPAIIAMTASSLYNMVDSIFIGQGVGALAISGLAVTFPFMNLAAAFGSLVGVGASTLISVKLGQRDYQTTRRVLGNVVTLNTTIGILFSIISLAFLDPILLFFGASPDTLVYAREYMEIILYGNIVTHMYLGLNSVVRASGHPKLSMFATILTVILNAILDPLFIFSFGWGIRGAAIATILAQIVTLSWQIVVLSNKKYVVHFERGTYSLHRRIVRPIFAIGMSPFLMNATACVIVIVINKSLYHYGGDMAIGAYGIVNRVAFFFIMVVMGLTQGMQPIAGYNFGARRFDRLRHVLRITIYWALAVTCSGFILCESIPELIIRAFTADGELIRQSVHGMRITFACFQIIGFQMVTSNFFQCIGMARQAIFLSLSRQLIFLLPGLFILPIFCGLDGVWLAMPLSDFAAAVTAAIVLWYYLRKFRRQEEAEAARSVETVQRK